MKSIRKIIETGALVWDEFFDPNMKDLWQKKTVLGRGSTGVVYDLGNGQVGKVQKFFGTPSPTSNDAFYEKFESIVYMKESFLHEALVMQELHKDSMAVIPQVFDVRFGLVQDQYYSLVIMKKVEGRAYIPYQIPPALLLSMVIELLSDLSKLYQKHFFIHGDLITDNMKISPENKITLIDFGLSSLVLNQVLYCRYHSFRMRLLPVFLKDEKILSLLKRELDDFTCPRFFAFLQARRQGIDICKILSPSPLYLRLPLKYRQRLQTCVGPFGSTLGPSKKPNPIYYSQKVISFDETIQILQTIMI